MYRIRAPEQPVALGFRTAADAAIDTLTGSREYLLRCAGQQQVCDRRFFAEIRSLLAPTKHVNRHDNVPDRDIFSAILTLASDVR